MEITIVIHLQIQLPLYSNSDCKSSFRAKYCKLYMWEYRERGKDCLWCIINFKRAGTPVGKRPWPLLDSVSAILKVTCKRFLVKTVALKAVAIVAPDDLTLAALILAVQCSSQQQIMESGRDGGRGRGRGRWWTWKAWMLFSTKSWLDVWHHARLLFYTCSTKAGSLCLPAIPRPS